MERTTTPEQREEAKDKKARAKWVRSADVAHDRKERTKQQRESDREEQRFQQALNKKRK